jgi:hypothetical protein
MPKKRRIFATRELELAKVSGSPLLKVHIVLYCPEALPNRGGFACAYQIKGLGNRPMKDGKGSDPVQAVIHALAKIGVELYKSEEAQAGRLQWCGGGNLGFPVFEAMTAFVPEPKDTLVI